MFVCEIFYNIDAEHSEISENVFDFSRFLVALDQMVACLPLVQQVRGSIPGGVVNFGSKIFNLGARRGGDVGLQFLIARFYITGLE